MSKPTKCSIIQTFEGVTFIVLEKEKEGKSYMCIELGKDLIDKVSLVEVSEDDIQGRMDLLKPTE